MTEVNTFSAAVDDVVLRSGRPDRQADIVSAIRSSIRELQILAIFSRDMTELSIDPASVDPFIWTTPQDFRMMRVASYPGLVDPQGNIIFPKYIAPGKKQNQTTKFFYRSLDSFVFAGHGSSTISLAYYSYSKKLAYFTTATRPATFSLENNVWSYLTATTSTDQETARDQVTNWLIFNWYDAVLEGALAKVYKSYGDDRTRSSFAQFSQFKKDLIKAEPRDALGLT